MDIGTLINDLRAEGRVWEVANNPRMQFGTQRQPFLMSRFLPEINTEDRVIRDEQMIVKSVIAVDAGRNAPVTPRGQEKISSNLFELADSNTGAEFTGQRYENLLKYLHGTGRAKPDMMAAAESLLAFEDSQIARPLAILRERYRCDMVVNARIIRSGEGGLYEVVDFPNPDGHRFSVPSGTVASPQGWYLGTYDPFQDIIGIRDDLRTDKGLTISAIITTQKIQSLLNRHPIVQAYGGFITRTSSNTIAVRGDGVVNEVMQPGALSAALAQHGLPSTMGQDYFLYDSRYDVLSTSTSTSTARFIPDNVFIMLCSTGRDVQIGLGDDVEPLPLYDTLGYTAVGPVLGEANPGVKVKMFPHEEHPPGIKYEGVQCAFPILQDPDCIVVITIPDPTP